jgi:hypothetical protein
MTTLPLRVTACSTGTAAGHDAGRGPPPSLVPVRDPSSRQVVRAELDRHSIAGENPDEMHPHLPRHVRENRVLVLELDPKHGIGQRFDDRSFYRYALLLRHFLSNAFFALPGRAAGAA